MVTVVCCSDPSEHSSLSSIQQTSDTAGCLAAKEGTSLRVKSKQCNNWKIYLVFEFDSINLISI